MDQEARDTSLHKSCCSLPCAACLAFWLALLSIALGLLAPIFVESMTQAGLKSTRVIDSVDAAGFQHFLNYTDESDNRFVVTFFNISNAAEVLSTPGVKPALEQIGPFVYNYYMNRSDVVFEMDGASLSYAQHTWTEFNAVETSAMTNGKHQSDNDVKITSINMLFLGMRVQAGRSYWHLICDALLWKNDFQRLFEHRTPRELLQGYSVAIKAPLLPAIELKFPGLFPNLPLDADPAMRKRSTIRNGAYNPAETFEFEQWHAQTSVRVDCPYGSLHLPLDEQCKVAPYPCCGQKEPVPLWDTALAPGEFDEDANAVQGTTGDQFRPGLHGENEQVVVFFDIAQRAMPFVTTPGEAQEDFQGVKLRKFRPARELLWANATERPANARFYQWGPSGLLNLTMLFGVDIFISLPHFLNCDQRLVDAVTGLKPDPVVHDLYLGVEPYSGITIVEQQRAMISAKVQAEPGMDGDHGWFHALGNRTLFVPVAWFNQQALATPDATAQFSDLYFSLQMQMILRYTGLGLGVVAVLWGLTLLVLWSRRRKHEPLSESPALLEQAATA